MKTSYARFALPLLLTSISPASTQPITIENSWIHTIERCGLAFSDWNAFIQSIDVKTNEYGNQVGRSPDGMLQWGASTDNLKAVQGTRTVVGDRRYTLCYTQTVIGDQLEVSEAINQALLDDFESRPGVTFSGGAMNPAKLGQGGTSGVGENSYGYVVLGALPDNIIAEIYLSPWYIEVLASRVVRDE